MTPGQLDATVVRRHLLAIDDALRTLLNERLEDFSEFARLVTAYLEVQAKT